MQRRLEILGALVGMLLGGTPAAASPDAVARGADAEIGPTAPPCAPEEAAPDDAVRRVFRALVSAGRAEVPGPVGQRMREQRRREVARASVDVEVFAREILGAAWEEAAPWRRERWRLSLEALLHRRYLERVGDPAEHVLEVDTVDRRCRRAVVDATLRPRVGAGGHDLELRLVWSDGGWRAWDVGVDDVGLARTYRSRFARIHRADGVDGVDERLAEIAHLYGVKLPGPPPPPADGVEGDADAADGAGTNDP